VNIELDEDWVMYKDPRTGTTHLQLLIEEGEERWLRADLNSPGRETYEGTEHHNSAAIIIKNGEREEEVSTRISVADPRGGFVMASRVNETGHYLSVPTDKDSAPHVDDMEARGNGYYKLKYYPAKRANEEEEEE
tara:strand:+ start:751 stop:1155 length:405 start_codon:yes stop_codon:yes gene_type:complete